MPPRKNRNELIAEIEALQARVEEFEEVLRAIRSGEVDALISTGPEGERVFSLTGAETTYRIILENINEGSVTLSSNGIVLYSNSRFSEMLKAPLEKIIGSSFHDYMDEHDRDKLTRLLKRGLKKGSNYEAVLLDKYGSPLPVYLSLNPLPSGEAACVSMIVTDISERKKAEEALRRAYKGLENKVKERTAELSETNKNLQNEIAERRRMEKVLLMSEETLLLAIRATDLGTFDYFPESGELLWSERLKRHFGLSADAKIDNNLYIFGLHPDDRKRVLAAIEKALSPEGSGEYKIEYRTIGIQDKKERWLSAQGQVYFNNERKPVRFVGTTLNITARKRMENDIRHMAHYDFLTDLPNRVLFADILNRELAHAQRNRKKLAVLFLDLDKFKLINDTLGHDFGDKLLKQVGERLNRNVRESDTVARIGGDEFNILMTDVLVADDVILIARKILDSMKEPFRVNGRELDARTSIGISIYPDDAGTIESLFKNADIAMYDAKDRGGDNYQFYSSSMNIRGS